MSTLISASVAVGFASEGGVRRLALQSADRLHKGKPRGKKHISSRVGDITNLQCKLTASVLDFPIRVFFASVAAFWMVSMMKVWVVSVVDK